MSAPRAQPHLRLSKVQVASCTAALVRGLEEMLLTAVVKTVALSAA